MKKTHKKIKMRFSEKLFFMCLLLFNTFFLCTCGLDKYEYIESPDYLIHRPYETSTFENKYFEFKTKPSSSAAFKGTAVYYRIYNSLSKMNTDVGTITNYIYSEDNKAKAAEKLLSTNEKNQGFKPLLYWDPASNQYYNEPILVNADHYSGKESYNIKIRLSDYQYDETEDPMVKPYSNMLQNYAYMAYIIFDDNADAIKRPIRYVENLTFNFGRYSKETNSRKPDAEDLDVCYSETTSEDDENRWYVPLFAVGVAMDDSYTYNYSVPLYMGFVIINDDEMNN